MTNNKPKIIQILYVSAAWVGDDDGVLLGLADNGETYACFRSIWESYIPSLSQQNIIDKYKSTDD